MPDTIDLTAPIAEVAKPVKEKKPAKPKYEGPACSVCGKPLTDPVSIKAGIGPLCRAKGWTKEKVAERMAVLKKDAVPEGWLKLSDLDKKLRLAGIPVARMVRAIGGDRGMDEPVSDEWQVVYVGRARYLSPFCFSEAGLNVLRDRYLGKPAPEKKERVVKVKLDGDGNPIPAKPKAEKKAKGEKAPADAKVSLDDVWAK